MGQSNSPTGIDLALSVSKGTLTGVGGSAPLLVNQIFNVQLSGTFVATMTLQRSFDGGVTFVSLSSDTSGTANSYTAPMSATLQEPEEGVIYRWYCSSFTSGNVGYRISQ